MRFKHPSLKFISIVLREQRRSSASRDLRHPRFWQIRLGFWRFWQIGLVEHRLFWQIRLGFWRFWQTYVCTKDLFFFLFLPLFLCFSRYIWRPKLPKPLDYPTLARSVNFSTSLGRPPAAASSGFTEITCSVAGNLCASEGTSSGRNPWFRRKWRRDTCPLYR